MNKNKQPKRHAPQAGQMSDIPVDNPHGLAKAWLASLEGRGYGVRVVFHRGDFFRWNEAAYVLMSLAEIRAQLTAYAAREFSAAHVKAENAWADRDMKGERQPAMSKVTTRLIGDVVQALQGECLLATKVSPPAWIGEVYSSDPRAYLAMPRVLINLHAAAAGEKPFRHRPTPNFFTRTAVGYDFDSAATAPRWENFLAEVWGDDAASIRALRQWFGYLLTADTSLQKILMMVGPPRSGKGTIVRVLAALVGETNVTYPELERLESRFAASAFVDKTLAVVTDMRVPERASKKAIVSRLLSISGEDAQHVEAKYRAGYDTRLATRFLIVSNEVPQLVDSSAALAGRMVVLRTRHRFVGTEDTKLTGRLHVELPGILNWALTGLADLNVRGRFTQPKSGREDLRSLRDMASPVGAFLRARCRLDPEERTEVAELYAAYREWCTRQGLKFPPTVECFGRDLRAAEPSVTVKQVRTDNPDVRIRCYQGVKLRSGSA